MNENVELMKQILFFMSYIIFLILVSWENIIWSIFLDSKHED